MTVILTDLRGRVARILGVAQAPERPALSRIVAVAILALGAAAMSQGAAVQAAPVGDAAPDRVVALFPGTGHGEVRLRCLMDVHGLAEHCDVLRETPAGKRFGAFAMQFPPIVRLKPVAGPDGVVAAYYKTFDISFGALATATASSDYTGSSGNGGGGAGSGGGQAVQSGLIARSGDILTIPVWATAPSFDDLAAAYPKAGGGVEGYAVLQCPVRLGALGKCRTIIAFPEGRGFESSALRLAAKFKLAPEQPNAPQSDSLFVDIPIRMPPPAALADHTVTAPNWLTGVDPRATPKLFPPEAAAAGRTSGQGVARCVVGPDGVLASCVAAPEAPGGLGFSQAAARLATGLKMTLWSADAAPVVGGVVDVPLRLDLKTSGG